MGETAELDMDRMAAFAGRLIGVVNDGMLALAVSLAHQSGLFDAMAGLAPSTSTSIAEAAGLQERYVREVLGSLTTGGIVTYDPAAQAYALPAEHAAVVTRAAGVNNIAALAQFIGVMGAVEQDVLHCFREGGGVPYSRFETFHRVMGEVSRETIDALLLTEVLDLDPGLRGRLQDGIEVADIGCGAGHAMNVLAQAFPESRFTGYDFCDEPIVAARAEAAELGLGNVTFEVRDVTDLDLTDAFDLITTFDAVHDQADPAKVLAGIASALRAGGTYLCVDIGASSHLEENLAHPLGPMLYTTSTMHCMTVSLALDGAGLGAMWGEQLAHSMLAAAGFTDVRSERLEDDPLNVYYVARRS
jgi:SAM-dependent methyltransferase